MSQMKIPKLRTNDFLKDTDCSTTEIISLFKLAAELKAATRKGKCHTLLKGKTLGMIFEKSSTRTRVSFEVGTYQLGGHALFLSKNDIQMGRGEPIEDTARVLSRYVDGIMIRTFAHSIVDELAKFADIPVINGLTDLYHPCQSYADYFSIYERESALSGLTLAFIGDGNNMAHSLLLTGALLGVNVAVAAPKGYQPDNEIVAEAEKIARRSGSSITITTNVEDAARGAQYLYTDVWASMGQEKEALKRKKAFSKYKITMGLIKKCCPDAKVMHCLPAHRGEEVDDIVLDSPHSIIFDEAENRLHIQKAIMCALLTK
ncbi:MAG TPA: ornithine carbamoyltransferase [Spirochaetota bacterium]